MPTIDRVGPYRLFFYSNENKEPAHVHIERDDKLAKYWLDPVLLGKSHGFSASELRKMEKIVEEKQDVYQEAWNDYFIA